MISSFPNNATNADFDLSRNPILNWLQEDDPTKLDILWRAADESRQHHVGDDVHLRGLIEISNYCRRRCAYCGINADNIQVTRYRMTNDEIIACVWQAVRFGYGTVVLQAGEDYGLTKKSIDELIRRIKNEFDLAITLSLGERSIDELTAWRKAGADRYLLRFETSNADLFARIHPPLPRSMNQNRIELLRILRELGYEIGSGVIIGIPGQSYNDLANDLELFRDLDLDMIGVGPFIPHPDTQLGKSKNNSAFDNLKSGKQVPNSELMTYKVVALSRLLCPRANIPSTTALATLNFTDGRELGLVRGANVLMPNLTPQQYRIHYEIYPNKACLYETDKLFDDCIKMRIKSIGRSIGTGLGSALK
jgi:biotin synthase